MAKSSGKESKVAVLQNEIAGLKLILTSAKESMEASRQKQLALESKITTLEAEKLSALVKADCLENTIHDIQKDLMRYKTEDLKMKKKYQCLEKAMGSVIAPALQAAIIAKVDDEMETIIPNLAKELESKMRLDLQLPQDQEDSPASSARSATSESPQPSTSGLSDTNPCETSDPFFY